MCDPSDHSPTTARAGAGLEAVKCHLTQPPRWGSVLAPTVCMGKQCRRGFRDLPGDGDSSPSPQDPNPQTCPTAQDAEYHAAASGLLSLGAGDIWWGFFIVEAALHCSVFSSSLTGGLHSPDASSTPPTPSGHCTSLLGGKITLVLTWAHDCHQQAIPKTNALCKVNPQLPLRPGRQNSHQAEAESNPSI